MLYINDDSLDHICSTPLKYYYSYSSIDSPRKTYDTNTFTYNQNATTSHHQNIQQMHDYQTPQQLFLSFPNVAFTSMSSFN